MLNQIVIQGHVGFASENSTDRITKNALQLLFLRQSSCKKITFKLIIFKILFKSRADEIKMPKFVNYLICILEEIIQISTH